MSLSIGAIAPERVIDARLRACPGPLLETRNAIATIGVGQTLEILSGAAGSREDIPAWCKKTGQEYLGHIERDGYISLFVTRRR